MYRFLKNIAVTFLAILVLAFGVCAETDENVSDSEGAVITDNSIRTTYVGDSFYGWSMLNPEGMYLDRDESGSSIMFYDESYNIVGISVEEIPEAFLADFDFDNIYDMLKKELVGYMVLSIAEKDAENRTIHFRAKADTAVMDYRICFSDKYMYIIVCVATEENTELLEIAESFTLGFKNDDCHDFSEAVDGIFRYKNEMLNLTLAIPAGFSEDYSNRFDIVTLSKMTDVFSVIMIQVVSADSATVTCEEYLNHSIEDDMEYFKSDFLNCTEITEKKYGELSVYEFTGSMSYNKTTITIASIAFELGEYQYRMNIALSGNRDEALGTIASVMENSEFNPIDVNEVGTIIDVYEKEEENAKEQTEIRTFRYGFNIPENVSYYDYTDFYEDEGCFAFDFGIELLPVCYTYEQHKDALGLGYELATYVDEKNEKKQKYMLLDSVTIKTDAEDIVFDMYSYTDNEYDSVLVVCVCENDGLIYTFKFVFPDMFYSDNGISTMNDIIKSFRIYGN